MLVAEQLECVRGGRRLFTDVGFELTAGNILRVSGDNGSGKTSLLRLLAGLSHPQKGNIFWHGKPVMRLGGEFRANLCYLGHLNSIKDELTPMENLLATAQLADQPLDKELATSALTEAGLALCLDLPCKFLSQGQKRRSSLARLCHDQRSLWILDEPFVALDSKALAWLCGLVEAHTARGGILVLTTHQAVKLNGAITDLNLGSTTTSRATV